MKRIVLLIGLVGVLLAQALPVVASSIPGPLHTDQYTIFAIYIHPGATEVASFSITTSGTLQATGLSVPSGGTVALSGAASCSDAVSCSIPNAPIGNYVLTYTPNGASNKVEIVVDLIPEVGIK